MAPRRHSSSVPIYSYGIRYTVYPKRTLILKKGTKEPSTDISYTIDYTVCKDGYDQGKILAIKQIIVNTPVLIIVTIQFLNVGIVNIVLE